jgi:hypothetical protein
LRTRRSSPTLAAGGRCAPPSAAATEQRVAGTALGGARRAEELRDNLGSAQLSISHTAGVPSEVGLRRDHMEAKTVPFAFAGVGAGGAGDAGGVGGAISAGAAFDPRAAFPRVALDPRAALEADGASATTMLQHSTSSAPPLKGPAYACACSSFACASVPTPSSKIQTAGDVGSENWTTMSATPLCMATCGRTETPAGAHEASALKRPE